MRIRGFEPRTSTVHHCVVCHRPYWTHRSSAYERGALTAELYSQKK